MATWAGQGRSVKISRLNWSRNLKEEYKAEIMQCKQELEYYRNQSDGSGGIEFERAREQLIQLLVKEENFWCQRAKTYWLRDGDLNTKFFHASASSRKKKN